MAVRERRLAVDRRCTRESPARTGRRDRNRTPREFATGATALRPSALRRGAARAPRPHRRPTAEPLPPAPPEVAPRSRESSRSTTRWAVRSPGRRPRSDGPPRSTWADTGRDRGIRTRRLVRPARRASPSCSLRSTASSTRRAHRRTSTRPGLTATSRTARPSTCARGSRRRSSASRRASENVCSPAPTRNSAELERENPNLVGGDIGGGANTLGQLIARPAPRLVACSTPVRGLYLCSSSTPPGGGVHGLCGHLAARAALRRT